jgi:PAS domain S-box-containing protein
LLATAGLLLLYVGHPLAWQRRPPALWFPPVGLGIVLVAWLGPRAAVLVGLAGLVVAVQAWVVGTLTGWHAALGALLDALVLALEVWLGWTVYSRIARGARRLGDPASAIWFAALVPGLIAGLLAPAHAILLGAAHPRGLDTFWDLSAAIWLSHALGILALAPLLLVAGTPWLVHRGVLAPEAPGEFRGREVLGPPTLGEGVEVGSLSLATAALAAWTMLNPQLGGPAGWHLAGLALLLVTWASLSRGLRGGIVVASTGVVLSLTLAFWLRKELLPVIPLQGQLLAECSTALLVGASAGWVRSSEARYRQVVDRVPHLLYSARVLRPGSSGTPPRKVELTFVSPACKLLLGCTPDQLLGNYEQWLKHVHPDDRELVLAALAQLSRQRESVTCEYRLAAHLRSPASGPKGSQTAGSDPSSLGLERWHPAETDRWVRDTLTPRYAGNGQLGGWEGVVVETTEQRRLAGRLRRSTNMFRALVARLPAGVVFLQGLEGRPIMVNARARQLLGRREYPAIELALLSAFYSLHKPDGTLYPAEDMPVCRALRLGLSSMRDDIVLHRPDGGQVPLITWAAPIDLGEPGQPQAAVWVFEDLTALRQAEAAHRESETRLRTIIETMAEGLIVYDRAGRVLQSNPAAAAICGLTSEQLRKRSLLDPSWTALREDGSLLGGVDHPAMVSLRTGQPVRGVILGFARPAANGRQSAEATEILGRVDGAAPTTRWVLVNAMPLARGPGARPARVVTTYTDITAYRQALDVLRASEEKYRGLVETVPVMLYQCDRDLHLTYWNPAAQAITGYALEDLHAPGAWHATLQREDLDRLLAVYPEVLAGQTARLELRFRAKDGSDKVGHAILQPHYHRNEMVGCTVLVVDMTVQRRLEAELQRAQRVEVVGRLASGIAHDFNNLLTVVLGLTEVALDRLGAGHPVSENLRQVAQAGEQAANLASQMLAFSKQRRVATRRVDVKQAVQRTLQLLRSTLPPNIAVESLLAYEELPVRADATQLQQVLMNLCLNARDAMPEGGRLIVRAEAVAAADGEEAPGWVHLSVQDSGHGIPANVLGQIFTPFFSTKERGTGLGLAVVQQIVESYGGRVEVWSEPGQGTRFDVWLVRDR